mmetsp:Transcript_22940/g.33861  ORF Transcript_22940/g.33861 Transcript_22940/m.33861 type:complete len:259 (-) Transcript_22940:194-970(-)
MISNFHGGSNDMYGGVSSASANNYEYSFGSNEDENNTYDQPQTKGGKKKKWWQQKGKKVGPSFVRSDSMEHSSMNSNMTSDSSTIFKGLRDDESGASSMMNSSLEGSALSGISSLVGVRFLRYKRKKNTTGSLLGELDTSISTKDGDDSLRGGDEDDELCYDAQQRSSLAAMKATVATTLTTSRNDDESAHSTIGKPQQEYQQHQKKLLETSQELSSIEQNTNKSNDPTLNGDMNDTSSSSVRWSCCGVSWTDFIRAF